jgi:epoxide hydrolase-like predicted phosphatase
MPIHAVIFDIGGVLLSYVGEDPMDRWDADLGFPKGGILASLEGSGLAEIGGKGQLREQEFWPRVGSHLALDEQRLRAFVYDLWSGYELNQELASFLNTLRSRYKTATLSNDWPGARQYNNSRYQLSEAVHVDAMIYSDEAGLLKPDERLFQHVCERLEVRPEEAIFLDDRVGHVEGAKRLGMQGIVFRNTAQAISDVQTALDTHSS